MQFYGVEPLYKLGDEISINLKGDLGQKIIGEIFQSIDGMAVKEEPSKKVQPQPNFDY